MRVGFIYVMALLALAGCDEGPDAPPLFPPDPPVEGPVRWVPTPELKFDLAVEGKAAPIYVDPADADVVRIAANMLAGDIKDVSGATVTIKSGTPDNMPGDPLDKGGATGTIKSSAPDNKPDDPLDKGEVVVPGRIGDSPLIAGTIGASPLVEGLISRHRIDVSKVKGRWEAFRIALVRNPWPNVPQALVVIGADRRGTAYGLMSLSREIGVSPWIW